MNHNFHIFRQNHKLKFQKNFIFVDTESSTINENNKEILKFKLGYGIFWNKETNQIIKHTYFNPSKFWIDIENSYRAGINQQILFAHNVEFDFKMLNGFPELFKRNWKLKSFYVRNSVFILVFWKYIKKYRRNIYLHVWSTTNYVKATLKEIGNSINFPKLNINFDDSTLSYLHIYCKRDTEIIFQYIKYLCNFLESNKLTKLKATSGSLAFNTYRHKFYKDKKENDRIYIHDWKKAINLERESYKGGITDCFKIGYSKDIYKTDINSMYPYIMKNKRLPYKLVFYSHESTYNQRTLRKIFDFSIKKKYGIIAKITIKLNKENAYILNKINDKSLFTYGIFQITVCLPEIKFIMKYGTILRIHEISIYKTRILFDKYVDFFYNLKVQYQKENNKILVSFCKLMLNTLYGKFGQKDLVFVKLDKDNEYLIKNQDLILLMIQSKKELIRNNSIVYLGKIVNQCELYVINNELYQVKSLEKNSKDSFVAISSFITSYSRMLLVKYLKIAKRENVVYCDTDSLFLTKEGYLNLKKEKHINKFELGKLKKEGFGNCTIYSPKFYDFNENRKIKGISQKKSILLNENDDKVVYEIQIWSKLKADLQKGFLNKQVITKSIKEISKIYDKGKVDDLGYVSPFSVQELT